MPKYKQLIDEILLWVHSGRLQPEDQMPSEHEIARQFGLSRQTVRQALSELEKEGVLFRLQGKGTFVAQMIRMITTHISDYIFPDIVRGTESALRRRGYGLLLASTDNSKERERESMDK